MVSDYPIVLVHWRDAYHESGWVPADHVADSGLIDQYTVGFLIHEDDEVVRVAQSLVPNEHVRWGAQHVDIIPKGWVVEQRVLKVSK